MYQADLTEIKWQYITKVSNLQVKNKNNLRMITALSFKTLDFLLFFSIKVLSLRTAMLKHRFGISWNRKPEHSSMDKSHRRTKVRISS